MIGVLDWECYRRSWPGALPRLKHAPVAQGRPWFCGWPLNPRTKSSSAPRRTSCVSRYLITRCLVAGPARVHTVRARRWHRRRSRWQPYLQARNGLVWPLSQAAWIATEWLIISKMVLRCLYSGMFASIIRHA